MDKIEFDTLLDKCYNEYSHEGEFSIKGWNIIIFRKTDEYADCVAFVSNENHYYFTGWYEAGENDLADMMDDAIKYMFENGFKVKVHVAGELDSDVCSEDYSAKALKKLVFADCIDGVDSYLGNIESLTVKVNKKAETFSADFDGGYWLWRGVKNNAGLFDETISQKVCLNNNEMKFIDQDVIDFTEQAFTYKTSFY